MSTRKNNTCAHEKPDVVECINIQLERQRPVQVFSDETRRFTLGILLSILRDVCDRDFHKIIHHVDIIPHIEIKSPNVFS